MARTSTSTRNRTSSNRSTTRNNATTRTAQTRSSPRRPRKINAKIGHMNNIDLPPLNMSTGGHYVYIRKKRGRVSVHTITSIESLTPDRKHTIPIVVNNRTGETRYISEKNLNKIRNGQLYPIPINDGNFTVWSGFHKNAITNINEEKIDNINQKKVKRKHKFFFK